MSVDYNGFEKDLIDGKRYNIYLFEGDDAYFGAHGLSFLKGMLVTEPSLNYAEFDGKADVAEIINSVNMYPFMSDYRLTMVEEFYPTKDEMKILSKEFQNPNERGIFVIINQKANADLKKLPNVCIIDCAKWQQNEVNRWIKKRCASNGVAIDGTATERISEYCLCEMFRVYNETEKLCAYVGKDGIITEKVVNELVWRDNEYKIYEMTDYVCRRKFDKALEVISDMLSKGEATQRLSVSLYNHYRRMLHVAISGERCGNCKIAGRKRICN